MFAQMPVALKPVYPTAAVNQAIELYEGDLELEHGTKRSAGRGFVRLEWLPRPGLRFSFDPVTKQGHRPERQDGVLHMLGINQHANVTVMGYSETAGEGIRQVRGIVEDCEMGQNLDIKYILYHIINFSNFYGLGVCNEGKTRFWTGRSVIDVGEWLITIDKVEEWEQLYKALREVGGFAVTHVGKVERKDGKTFKSKSTDHLFEALFRYLSTLLADPDRVFVAVKAS